jgi:hypothetical protein
MFLQCKLRKLHFITSFKCFVSLKKSSKCLRLSHIIFLLQLTNLQMNRIACKLKICDSVAEPRLALDAGSQNDALPVSAVEPFFWLI